MRGAAGETFIASGLRFCPVVTQLIGIARNTTGRDSPDGLGGSEPNLLPILPSSSTFITLSHQFLSKPVRVEEFESGKLPDSPSVPEQLLVYLYTNRDKAFTLSEIATGIEEDPNPVGTALSRLKQRNLVRHKGEYRALTEDLTRVQDAFDLHTATEQLDDEDGGIDPDEWDAVAPAEPHPSERD